MSEPIDASGFDLSVTDPDRSPVAPAGGLPASPVAGTGDAKPRRRRWRTRLQRRGRSNPAGVTQVVPMDFRDLSLDQQLEWAGQLLSGLGGQPTSTAKPGRPLPEPAVAAPVASTEAPAVLTRAPFDWVFACSAVLGSVVPGTRVFTYNGKPLHFRPSGSLGAGTRWCSSWWLADGPGERGHRARAQGMFSYMSLHLSGRVTAATVLVLPDDSIGDAAAILSESLGSDDDDPKGLTEWSFALARQTGRTRTGVWFKGPDERAVSERLARDIGIDWRISFRPGANVTGGSVIPDVCTFTDTSGAYTEAADGLVLLEDEPIPDELLALAYIHGTSIGVARASGTELRWPTAHNRPLEVDEPAENHGYLGAAADSEREV